MMEYILCTPSVSTVYGTVEYICTQPGPVLFWMREQGTVPAYKVGVGANQFIYLYTNYWN